MQTFVSFAFQDCVGAKNIPITLHPQKLSLRYMLQVLLINKYNAS